MRQSHGMARSGLLAHARGVIGATACLASIACAPLVSPASASPLDRAGDAYEIRIERITKTTGDSGSSSSSRDRNTAIERVVAVSKDGVELEFDAPSDATEQDRLRSWQLPVRVLHIAGRPLELLNEGDVQKRLDAYLQELLGGNSRAACGQWFFTWTAIKVECDPKSAVSSADMFLLRPADLRVGAMYGEPSALGTTALQDGGGNEHTFVAKLPIDGEVLRRERAEADIIVAQMMAKPALTFEDAMRKRASMQISGTVTITFETDDEGRVTRRTRAAEYTTVDAGVTERTSVTETTDRRRLS